MELNVGMACAFRSPPLSSLEVATRDVRSCAPTLEPLPCAPLLSGKGQVGSEPVGSVDLLRLLPRSRTSICGSQFGKP